MPTLNQTIEIFEQFSYKHKAIGKNLSRNNFFFGDSWEVGASGNIQYPLVWLSKLPTTYDKSGMVIHKFQVDISDKVNSDESNETNVLSDTEQWCFHLVDYLEMIADSQDFIINIGSVSEITDYTEKRDDRVSGNYFTVEIKSHNSNNSCNLPIFDGTIFNENYIYLNGSITPITASMNIITETFIYGTDALVLANTPIDILTVFAGASILFVTDDYTLTGSTFTITNPLVENGDKIRITYTY